MSNGVDAWGGTRVAAPAPPLGPFFLSITAQHTHSTQAYRDTFFCPSFSPSTCASYDGPSGRRASVLDTCMDVNILAGVEREAR